MGMGQEYKYKEKGKELPSLAIGYYVRIALSCEKESTPWIDHEWQKLMKTFSYSMDMGIALVDLDLTIGNDALYNALGFACIVAIKMGSNRILLAGSIPICVDISECDGFCEMVRLLWSHCENRGTSVMRKAITVLDEALQLLPDDVIRVFVFSQNADWSSIYQRLNYRPLESEPKVVCVFWNLGSKFSMDDDCLDDNCLDDNCLEENDCQKGFIYMSGYSSGLMHLFLHDPSIYSIQAASLRSRMRIRKDDKLQGDFISDIMICHYGAWNDFFEEFWNRCFSSSYSSYSPTNSVRDGLVAPYILFLEQN